MCFWVSELKKQTVSCSFFPLQFFRFLPSFWGWNKSRKFHRPCETRRAVWDRKTGRQWEEKEDGKWKIFLHRRMWRDIEGCDFESNTHLSIWGLRVGFLHILFFLLPLLERLTLGWTKRDTGNRTRSGEEQTAVLEWEVRQKSPG